MTNETKVSLQTGEMYHGLKRKFTFTVDKIENREIYITWNAPDDDRTDIEFKTELQDFLECYGPFQKFTKLERILK